ncbi:MAG: hypothetical protein WC565_00335 [Parcubacteria group bacterium]
MSEKTSVFAPVPIVAAMKKVLQVLKLSEGAEAWDQVRATELQRSFFHDYYALRGKNPLECFSKDELKSYASASAETLNKILERNGFPDMRLADLNRWEFGTAAILDVMLSWRKKGIKTNLKYEGKNYPAVEMAGGLDAGFEIVRYKGNDVAAIKTKNGDVVYMTIADKAYEGFALANRINAIADTTPKNSEEKVDSLYFPMIDAKVDSDISWLCGLRIKRTDFYIAQALEQTKIRMDETGVRVTSAVSLGMQITAYARIVRIDKPFFMWIERTDKEGGKLRYFYGYFAEDSWKAPEGLTR